MTTRTVYIPRLIESAEQADALPEGAIVVNDDGDRYNRLLGVGKWHSAADDRGLDEDLDSTYWPRKITALVPIEAEEETREHPTRHEPEARPGEAYLRPATMTRFVTPWAPQQ